MGNFLAVAASTAVVQRILEQGIASDVAEARVWTRGVAEFAARPSGCGVNLCLIHVAPQAASRSGTSPGLLDLTYLVTFVGSDERLEPQRLLGSVLRTLASNPVVGASTIDAVTSAAVGSAPRHAYLAAAELEAGIRIVPEPLTTQDLAALWSNLVHRPYLLSAVIRVSSVSIDSGAG